MKKRYRKKQTQMPLYIGALLLLMIGMLWAGTQRPSATPEQITAEHKVYKNAWIVSAKEDALTFMADGILMQSPAEDIMELNNTLADIELKNGRVQKIAIKKDMIGGRVLAIGEDFIEIEGYGRLPLSEYFAVYQTYGELCQKDYKSILVGYEEQKFIVGDGQVCGAIIEREAEATLIRVLLKGNYYEGDTHENISVRCDEGMLLETAAGTTRIEPGTELVLTADSAELTQGRAGLSTESGNGRITITSLQRAQGNPSYYGRLEIRKQDNRLTVINEVNLEKYLYFVVPSEMPESYGLEALKAQAVCARSYACRHILANSLSAQGAHVDDSSYYQVYNNYPDAPLCTQAVDETKGQIMTYEGELVQAYYFSTSCGYTTDADIWHDENELPYIQGRRVWKEEEETDFATAIMDWDYPAYDAEFPWYRWRVDFTLEDLSNCVSAAGFEEAVGAVQGLEVGMRGKNGVVKSLTVRGEKGSVVIETEYAIRKFLNPEGLELHRKDGEAVVNFSLLPSGYFLLREITKEEGLQGYRIEGGGFGHGAGMSQNAAKAMAEEGMSYIDILRFFYQKVEIESSAENSIFDCCAIHAENALLQVQKTH